MRVTGFPFFILFYFLPFLSNLGSCFTEYHFIVQRGAWGYPNDVLGMMGRVGDGWKKSLLVVHGVMASVIDSWLIKVMKRGLCHRTLNL